MSQPFSGPDSPLFAELWSLQAGLCALCQKPMMHTRFEAPHARIWAKQRATFDHIMPRSKGGGDQRENLQLAHARCNKIKGNRV